MSLIALFTHVNGWMAQHVEVVRLVKAKGRSSGSKTSSVNKKNTQKEDYMWRVRWRHTLCDVASSRRRWWIMRRWWWDVMNHDDNEFCWVRWWEQTLWVTPGWIASNDDGLRSVVGALLLWGMSPPSTLQISSSFFCRQFKFHSSAVKPTTPPYQLSGVYHGGC